MNRFAGIVASAAAILLTVSPPAAAVVIGFDALASPTMNRVDRLYVEQGFGFTGELFQQMFSWGADTPQFSADPGGGTMNNYFGHQFTEVMRVGGGYFDLVSMDITELFNNANNSNGAEVLFHFVDRLGKSSQTVFVDNRPGFETFTFNRTGLRSFAYRPVTGPPRVGVSPFVQSDNFVVNPGPELPEPASWLMIFAGFGVIGAALRWQRLAAQASPIRAPWPRAR